MYVYELCVCVCVCVCVCTFVSVYVYYVCTYIPSSAAPPLTAHAARVQGEASLWRGVWRACSLIVVLVRWSCTRRMRALVRA